MVWKGQQTGSEFSDKSHFHWDKIRVEECITADSFCCICKHNLVWELQKVSHDGEGYGEPNGGVIKGC